MDMTSHMRHAAHCEYMVSCKANDRQHMITTNIHYNQARLWLMHRPLAPS